MEKIKILLASWEKVFWEGLSKALSSRPDVEIVAVCLSGHETIRTASELKPDVVFIDEGIRDCGFIEVSKSIRRLLPQTYIAIFTVSYPNPNIVSTIQAEADIYVDKDITLTGFNALIHNLHEDGRFYTRGVRLCPPIAEQLVKEFKLSQSSNGDGLKENRFGLSKREVEVLTLVAKGKSNKEIANTLFVTENTIKAHMSSILEKLHLRNRQQVAALAKEKGIVPSADS